MSDGSNSSSKTLAEPLRHIGAQDILKIEGKMYDGILRKRGKIDQLLGSTKWKRRFVVISQGCVYWFKDEYAQRPLGAFSLAVYETVNEVELGGVLNCFEIVHELKDRSSHYFSCETDDKRKAWIGYLQDAISQAHMFSGGKLSSGSDEGICMGPKLTSAVDRKSRGPLPPLPDKPSKAGESSRKYKAAKSEYDLESEDDEEPYSTVPDEPEAPRKLLPGQVPVLPSVDSLNILKSKRQSSVSSRPPMPIPSETKSPPAASKPAKRDLPPEPSSYTPTTVHRDHNGQPVVSISSGKPGTIDYVNDKPFEEKDYFLDSNNKEAVKGLLTGRPVGTFLIRRGNNTPTVLCVVTDQGSKDFQIFEEDGKVSLNKSMWFPSRDAMLTFYSHNNLPKKEYSVMLKKGYAFKG